MAILAIKRSAVAVFTAVELLNLIIEEAYSQGTNLIIYDLIHKLLFSGFSSFIFWFITFVNFISDFFVIMFVKFHNKMHYCLVLLIKLLLPIICAIYDNFRTHEPLSRLQQSATLRISYKNNYLSPLLFIQFESSKHNYFAVTQLVERNTVSSHQLFSDTSILSGFYRSLIWTVTIFRLNKLSSVISSVLRWILQFFRTRKFILSNI